MLPSGPVVALLRSCPDPGHVVAERLGIVQGTLYRALSSDTMSIFLIDDICTDFGVHPVELYGDAWIEALLPPPPTGEYARRLNNKLAAMALTDGCD